MSINSSSNVFVTNSVCIGLWHKIKISLVLENIHNIFCLLAKMYKRGLDDSSAAFYTKIFILTSATSNVTLSIYFFESSPTESTAIGTMLYIFNRLSYEPGIDINIYRKNQLESTFIEIINSKKSNIFVGLSMNIQKWVN